MNDPGSHSADRPAPGLVVWQPRRGYRYGLEVYLLADFVLRGPPVQSAIELGAGSGVVALLLGWAGLDVTAVEREPRWVDLARRSATDSDLAERVRVVEADARRFEGVADVVVTNPPWFDPRSGPVSPDPWRAASRTALHGTPEDLVAAGLALAPRVCVVGPRVPRVGVAVRRARYGRLVLSEIQARGSPGEENPVDVAGAYRRFGQTPSG